MERTSNIPTFETPNFFTRLKGMLAVDFYRLFHTPLFYIFLAIAAIIPALIMGTMGGGEEGNALFTNVWQAIAVDKPLYVVEDIGQYANMNMVFIFGGIMVSIFIGKDYKSGYVKQLFTTHAKKEDYMISKTLSCAFAMACMCITYLLGSILAGAMVKLPFTVDGKALVCALLGKIIMSLGWASLYTFLNVIFRKHFWISIASSFFFGTGILIIGAAAIVEGLGLPASFLNVFLYGASVNANLSSGIGSLLICVVVSVAWAVIYNTAGTKLLNRCDVY